MKKFPLLCIAAFAAGSALAQTTPAPTTNTDTTNNYDMPGQDVREFTIGGSGSADRNLDSSAGGIEFSYGRYTSDNTAWVWRQSILYTDPPSGGNDWYGATRLAYDWHFGRGAARPFIGLSGGGIYGDGVRDSWAAGLETGVKFYVQSRTFIQLLVEYAWLFNDGDEIDDRFDDGRWNWSIGVGYNF